MKIATYLMVIVLFSSFAFADGGFFPRVYYQEDIFEPEQKAMILFDGSKEQLIIQASYEGEMNEFAWVVPVPSYPIVEKSDSKLFEELHYLTEPEYKRAPRLGFSKFASIGESRGVTVHETKQVGLYEVSVISSDDPKAMIEWLNANEYYISDKAEFVLNDYIVKKWYFAAMKINLQPVEEGLVGSLQQINPTIATIEDGKVKISNDIIEAIKSEKLFQETNFGVTLDFGEIKAGAAYRHYESQPFTVIDSNHYTRLYEQYNGYLYETMLREIQGQITTNVYNNYQIDYISKDSEDYKILDGTDCGDYCLSVKDEYKVTEIANAAANAILEGDNKLESHFLLYPFDRRLDERHDDAFRRLLSVITSRLEGKLREQANRIAIEDIYDHFGVHHNTIHSANFFLAQEVLNNIEKSYSENPASKVPKIISNSDYAKLQRLHRGDADEIKLRSGAETAVQQSLDWGTTTVQRILGQGTIQPISLTFDTKEIIYPLKISSINKGITEILLYVFAKYRTTADNFEVEFAQWIDTEDIDTGDDYRYYSEKEIEDRWYPGTYYYLNQILDDRYFLTKMRTEMWPKEMTDDVLITQAENDKEYKLVVREHGYYFSILAYFIVLALIFLGLLIPRWINNRRVISDSPYYISWKRNLLYTFIVPIFAYVFAMFGFGIFEFVVDVLYRLYIPREIGILVMFVISGGVFFLIPHLIISRIMRWKSS